jgi:hypothetical protein
VTELSNIFDKLEERFDEFYKEAFERSWFAANRPERKHRIKYVLQLSAELERIKAQSIQATLLGQAAIEDLIEGNYREMIVLHDDLSFADEDEEFRDRYVQLWTRFRELLQEAYDRRPGQPGGTLQ